MAKTGHWLQFFVDHLITSARLDDNAQQAGLDSNLDGVFLRRSSSAKQLVALGLFAVFQFLTFADFARAASAAVPVVTAQPISPAELQPRLERGKTLYLRNCFI